MKTPECVWDAHALLGEGPLWSDKEQALYWVDILGHRLHRYSMQAGQKTWDFDQEISAIAEREQAAGLVITQRHGFAFFDPASSELRQAVRVEPDMPGNRFNDGKVDRMGRFWAGTMDFACKSPTGSLYRLTPDLEVKRMDTGYPVTNGPAWSADYRTMYHNDSVNGRVFAFDFDLESGEVANKRLFLQFEKSEGSPDGMTTDAEGGLWIAHWGASKVTRHDPHGKITHAITLPCSQITSVAFGGPHFRTLFITSAADGLGPRELEREPLAGGLFAVDLDIAGAPANKFKG
ncbi:SMP-30/gluconolactonase/LRE family protein [Noviherbaspirillum galbum]|uniref:SMP-30/gluconolactonase/LRE family protein n=1 Tax=Noviherbaspirillum galbum TaxID=2709383 RepID=A0A6B3SM27_9BURK|nr:SMP-30/gluconolactonase/LRE family protein [Noviherbaspirillum galbum]NEX59736.1 SMP-30/gluconolactonase/LRE family protein [Noviherbaspirillum galbum]